MSDSSLLRTPFDVRLPLWLLGLCILQATGSSACKDTGSKPILEDASFARRVFRPPPAGEVRAVPPHNIHGKGVGPYELSASFQKTLALLPNGPRVERFESEGLFDYRLMRTDNDALLLGVGRRNRVTFISVLDPDIARTESGIGVGAGVDELVSGLGGVVIPEGTVRDSRIVSFRALPNTRFIVEEGTVVAAVVTESPIAAVDDEVVTVVPVVPVEPVAPVAPVAPVVEGSKKPLVKTESKVGKCQSDALRSREAEILEVAEVGSEPNQILWTCLSSDSGEAVVQSGDWIKIVSSAAPGAPLRVVARAQVPGLRFVAALNTSGDRVELYSVSNKEDEEVQELLVTRHRVSGARIAAVWTRSAFKLQASAASWLGAELEATEFLGELRAGDRLLRVSGIFMQRKGGVLRNVVPMNTVELLDGSTERRGTEMPAPGKTGDEIDAGASMPSPSPTP